MGGLDNQKKEDAKDLNILEQVTKEATSIMFNCKVLNFGEHQQSVVVVWGGDVTISYPELSS